MTVSRLGPGGYPKELYGSFAGRPVFIRLMLTDAGTSVVFNTVTLGGGFNKGFSSGFAVANITTLVIPPGHLLLPVNCVVAGQQKQPNKLAMNLNSGTIGPMRGIFGE